jgi:hypothetical protein
MEGTNVCLQMMLREIDELKRKLEESINENNRLFRINQAGREELFNKIENIENTLKLFDEHNMNVFRFLIEKDDKRIPSSEKQKLPRSYRCYKRFSY